MAIKVNKYRVRYKGVPYGPGQSAGQIIVGLSEEEEALLIANSGGTIERYPNFEEKKLIASELPNDEDQLGEEEQLDDEPPEELTPDISIEELIKPVKGKKSGEK